MDSTKEKRRGIKYSERLENWYGKSGQVERKSRCLLERKVRIEDENSERTKEKPLYGCCRGDWLTIGTGYNNKEREAKGNEGLESICTP